MSARTQRPQVETSAAALLSFLRSLSNPLKPLGFFVPGVRSKMVRTLGRVESVLEEAVSSQVALDALVRTSQQFREEMAASAQATEKVARIQENRTVQDQIHHEKLNQQIDKLAHISESNLRLAEREEAVRQREGFARETATRLQSQMESAVRTEEEVQKLLREASGLYSGAQALQEVAHRKETEVAQLANTVEGRRRRLEAFKLQIQSREQTVQQAQSRMASLEEQRAALQEELKEIKRRAAGEVARGEEIVRERERELLRREEQFATVSLLVTERERALQERENLIEAREEERRRLEKSLETLQKEIETKVRRVESLEEATRGLLQHREELQQILAGLSAKL